MGMYFSNVNELVCKHRRSRPEPDCDWSLDFINKTNWCPSDVQGCYDTFQCKNQTAVIPDLFPFEYTYGFCLCGNNFQYMEIIDEADPFAGLKTTSMGAGNVISTYCDSYNRSTQ